MTDKVVYLFDEKTQPEENFSEAQRHSIRQAAPQMPVLRWNRARKAAVVATIIAGVFTREHVCKTYELSCEELDRWIALMDDFGVNGLEVTKVQKWRDAERATAVRQSVA
jgi:hypothetical protein